MSEGQSEKLSGDALLDAIDIIAAETSLDAAQVTELTGHPLRPVSVGTTHFAVFRTSDAPGDDIAADSCFTSVEFRKAHQADAQLAHLLILTPDPAAAVSADDVLDRYGRDAELAPANPRQPPDDPHFYVYRFEWGVIRFGISRDGKETVKRIVIERNAQSE